MKKLQKGNNIIFSINQYIANSLIVIKTVENYLKIDNCQRTTKLKNKIYSSQNPMNNNMQCRKGIEMVLQQQYGGRATGNWSVGHFS